MKERSFAIYTLGCKVNQEEAAALEAAFLEAGYDEVLFSSSADIYIINTCTVTSLADRKSRAMIRRARKSNPDALIVVTGCYAQVSPLEIKALDCVDLILGVDERAELLDLVEKNLTVKGGGPQVKISDVRKDHNFIPLAIATEKQKRARAFLKIQDGCNQFCHYCIIPYARGASRSLSQKEVLKRAQKLIDLGHLEIVLSGIHIGVYGNDLDNGDSLNSLIKNILKLPGLGRLHLGSLEIQHINKELIGLFSENEKLCPHLHIPLQSGSNSILKAMGRKYSTMEYEGIIKEIRKQIPDISITTDVIVGYSGEGEKEFEETYVFSEQMAFSKMHIFPFSPRKGTVAYDLKDQVPDRDKKIRVKKLTLLAQNMQNNYGERYIGKPLQMLIEQEMEIGQERYWSGHSENYLSLMLPLMESEKGALIPVYGERWQKNSLFVKKEK